MDYSKHFSTKETPQTEPIPGKKMVKDSAGGYAFPVDDWARLNRFLILGTEGGTYYIKERKLTIDSAKAVARLIEKNGPAVVGATLEVSDQGRAPKNDPALFVLAMCAGMGDEQTRTMALAALPKVARIGTHLFHFAKYVKAFRGWGRGLRNAVKHWYQDKDVDRLAYQAVKYQQRDGWSHRDLLRLSHPKTDNAERNALYKWIVSGELELPEPDKWKGNHPLNIVAGFEYAKKATSKNEIVNFIQLYNLPREAIPTDFLTEKVVWDALLEKMPMTAMIRNLGNMGKVGLLKPGNWDVIKKVVTRITDAEILKKARIHPISILAALKIYGEGRGYLGKGDWDAVPEVVDALDAAFYLAFDNVQPTGKRIVIGLDVSSSMDWDGINGMPYLTPRDGACAMAMVTFKTEENCAVMAFAHELRKLSMSRHQRLDDVIKHCQGLNFGGTDCSLPILWALQENIEAEGFVIYTDNETWAGSIHPSQALEEYRRKMGIPAKLVVVGMASNEFSIADPTDGGMMDVVGFNTATPAVIGDFIANR